jgi:hypothetical protein
MNDHERVRLLQRAVQHGVEYVDVVCVSAT